MEDNFAYLFAAYTIIWAVVFGYVLSLSRRASQLRRELESLKRSLEERNS
ncbi:MAG: CcmD family protein [Chloroflexi bacterium]|nr:CcmD family protein [Chloroflexota bacterium]